MNTLLEQFLTESRDLLEVCSDGFLTLEKDPTNPDLLNELFRSIHTIKGGSGLFDVLPFTRLVHVAEDTLSRARAGEVTLDANSIDTFFLVIDQVERWLTELETSETLGDDAEAASDKLIRRLEEQQGPVEVGACKQGADVVTLRPKTRLTAEEYLRQLGPFEGVSESNLRSLLTDLVKSLGASTGEAHVLVYRPQEQAFFNGDDPLSLWRQVPDMVWQQVLDTIEGEAPESFDPYQCRVTFIGLSLAEHDEIKASLDYVWDDVKAIEVPALQTTPAGASEELHDVLHAQWRLLSGIGDCVNPEQTYSSVCRVMANAQQSVAKTVEFPQPPALLQELGADYLDALALAVKDLKAPEVVEPEKTGEPEAASMKVEPLKTLKVDQERLEQLVDLTGELIVAKNSMQHLARRVELEYDIKPLSRDLKSEYSVLNRISESLQGVVMQIRMTPIGTIFQRFPRLVRDLSRKLDKDIELIVEGEETEADKSIVEQLADPLIHLVRNSLDHGIESPEVREANGKPAKGTIRLTAKNVDDNVVIEVHDDGAGMCPDKLRKRAVEKGVLTAEKAEALTDDEALHLIFEPGFSTVENVTDISGRGVGMDVVRTTVERVNGHIDISSTLGKGSVLSVSLPTSITVTRVMMFEMNDQVYGIPSEALTETIKIPPSKVKQIKSGEAYVLRNQLIPMHRMSKILGVKSNVESEELSILNLNINGQIAGFVVDKLLEGVDVIVKPLDGVMARFETYSGAAVLGNGRVLLVINPKEISVCQ